MMQDIREDEEKKREKRKKKKKENSIKLSNFIHNSIEEQKGYLAL